MSIARHSYVVLCSVCEQAIILVQSIVSMMTVLIKVCSLCMNETDI